MGTAHNLTWLAEWRTTQKVYRRAPVRVKRIMERRALQFAALTIHTPWIETYRRWQEGLPPALPCAEGFYAKRRRLRPWEWCDVNPHAQVKSHFARALLGYDDAACFDTWMVRYFSHLPRKQWRGSTVWQWAYWLLKIYPAVYPYMKGQVIPQHCNVLRWIRTGRKVQEQVQQRFFTRRQWELP